VAHRPRIERAEWLIRLETEYENLRIALESYRTTEGHTEQQLRLAGALREFWSGQGHWTEGREWAEEALRQSGAEIPTWVRAKAHAMVGTLAWEQARYATAVPHLEHNLSFRREIGDRPGIADALRRLGSVLREQGEQGGFAVARAHFEEALAISREADDRTGVAWSLHALGTVAHYERDNAAARRLYEAAAAMRQELGDPDIAWTLSSLGSLAYREGDYAAARAHFARSLALFRESSDRYGIVLTLKYCGWLAAAQGQARRAIPLLGAMHALSEPLGMSLPLVERTHHDRILGAARAVQGEAAFAAAWAEGTALELEQAVAYALDGEGELSGMD
jgi:tetratricopeptide (TPR) repeat protein